MPFDRPESLAGKLLQIQNNFPLWSRPAGDLRRELMPVDRRESLAGKLLQIQNNFPL